MFTDCTKHASAGPLIHRQQTVYCIFTRTKLSSIYRRKLIGPWWKSRLLTIQAKLKLGIFFVLFGPDKLWRNPRRRVARGGRLWIPETLLYPNLSFSQLVSGRNSTNPAIWLVPGAGGIFSPGPPQRAESVEFIYFRERISGNRQSFALFTLPSTINQRKFISIHLQMARKVIVSKFNWVFWSCESLFGCL